MSSLVTLHVFSFRWGLSLDLELTDEASLQANELRGSASLSFHHQRYKCMMPCLAFHTSAGGLSSSPRPKPQVLSAVLLT